ncbi:MAG TPA: AI-2E family transporter [Vicinamibacteria bacterium]|nr:AI-2E family transporter [Vicinamibacteria bacterium]
MARAVDTRDLTRIVLAVLFILGLAAGSLFVLRPFLTALVGGATIAISTWPLLVGLERRWKGRRGLAVAAMMALLAIAVLAPLYFGAVATVQSAGALTDWVHELQTKPLPPLPERLAAAPLVGPRLEKAWGELASGGGGALRARLSVHSGAILRWLAGRIGSLLGMLAQTLLTLGVTGILYARGERVGASVLRFARRLAGDRGEEAARLAALATRGVGLGVVLTPLIQSILAGVGIAAAGAPHVGLLSLLVLLSCLAQAGPIPALLVPVIWLYARGSVFGASGLLVWALVVHVSGPIVRPILIKRGVDLPMVLIISGVIGGVMAFGAVGLFIGPVLLAVTTTLLGNWMADEGQGTPEAAAPAPGRVQPLANEAAQERS